MKNKTVFVEYSSADKGQHFMTVMYVEDGKRKIIGRIYKEYDPEIKKYTCRAQDWSGTPVFVDYKRISELKTKFINHGKSMADKIPRFSTRLFPATKKEFVERKGRDEQLKSLRKQPEIKRGKTEEKENKQEKEEEPKVEYKAWDKEWDEILTDETGDGRPFPEPDKEIESPFPAEMNRQDELEQLRDDDYEYDRGDDMDMDR
jgi:hypothetical protein